jgi:hypothetical protein
MHVTPKYQDTAVGRCSRHKSSAGACRDKGTVQGTLNSTVVSGVGQLWVRRAGQAGR